jgi:hypothetical protein
MFQLERRGMSTLDQPEKRSTYESVARSSFRLIVTPTESNLNVQLSLRSIFPRRSHAFIVVSV